VERLARIAREGEPEERLASLEALGHLGPLAFGAARDAVLSLVDDSDARDEAQAMTGNVEMLARAAEAFGELKDEVVFVGGAVVDLFITDPAAPRHGSRRTWTSWWRSRPTQRGPKSVSGCARWGFARTDGRARRSAAG
jgi:hypothetical protein